MIAPFGLIISDRAYASAKLDDFIEKNVICINDIILAELVPYLKIRGANRVIDLLNEVKRIQLQIDWQSIINFQTLLLENGVNKVGIPDLIILQNVLQNSLVLYSFDKHFKLICQYFPFELLSE